MTPTEPPQDVIQMSGPIGSSTLPKIAKTVSRKTRESVQEKALRLLTQGRLRVTKVDGDLVQAECRGDSGKVYELGHDNGHWNCSCPARTACSHLTALWLVTAVAG